MSELSFFSQWHILWRQGIVHICFLCLCLFNLISFPFIFIGEIQPYFILMAIYYWGIFRPSFLLPIFLFVIGILYDLILGFPVGLHAFLFLGAQFLIIRQRLFLMGQPFVMMWIGFFLLCLGYVFCEWVFFSLYSSSLLPMFSLLGSVLLNGLLFPIISFLLSLLSRFFLPGTHFISSK